MSYVLGALMCLGWLLLGLLTVQVLRPDLGDETLDALANMVLWPLGIVMYKLVWPIYRWRRERARQARITAKVESGAYDVEHARNLGWKG